MAHDDQRRREIVAALRGVALLRGLTDEGLAGLAGRVVRRRYARNEVIFGPGPCTCTSEEEAETIQEEGRTPWPSA